MNISTLIVIIIFGERGRQFFERTHERNNQINNIMQFIENHTILFLTIVYAATILIQIITSVITNWNDLKIGNILCPFGWEGNDIWATIFGTYFPIVNTMVTLLAFLFGTCMGIEAMFDRAKDTKFFLKIKNFLNKNIK